MRIPSKLHMQTQKLYWNATPRKGGLSLFTDCLTFTFLHTSFETQPFQAQTPAKLQIIMISEVPGI